MVVLPDVSRLAVSPGARVMVSVSEEIGVEGSPFTWYSAGLPVIEGLNRLFVPS
jgi:hypothetical protein